MTRISSVLLLSSPLIDSRRRRSSPSFSRSCSSSAFTSSRVRIHRRGKSFRCSSSSSELERWDDWRLDEAWGDTDDDVSNNDDFVQGTTKNTKTLNRSDPLSSPLEETEEGIKEGKNREENIFSKHQNAEEKGIAIAREKIDDANDDVKDDAEKEKERKYYLGYENDKRSKVLVEFWRSSFPDIKDFDVLNMMKLGQDYAKLRDCELVITMD